MPLAAKGEFALVREKVQSAFAKSGQPVKRGTMAHDHHLYMLLTESAAQRRDAGELQEFTPQLERLAARDGHRLYQAIAHRAWGVGHRLRGDLAEAAARLGLALEMFQSLGTKWQTGRTLIEMAELAACRYDPTSARQLYLRAQTLFEALQAAPDASRTGSALAALD